MFFFEFILQLMQFGFFVAVFSYDVHNFVFISSWFQKKICNFRLINTLSVYILYIHMKPSADQIMGTK